MDNWPNGESNSESYNMLNLMSFGPLDPRWISASSKAIDLLHKKTEELVADAQKRLNEIEYSDGMETKIAD